MLDKAVVDKWIKRYPELAVAMLSGVCSMKMVREMIGVDRWFMNDIYKELVLAGAVKGVSTAYFKATDECRPYLQEKLMRKTVEEDKNE